MKNTGSATFPVRWIAYTAAQTFKEFAVVVRAAAGTIEEDTTDPDSIVGVALQRAASGHGFNVPDEDRTDVFTGRETKVCVALASPGLVEFISEITNAGVKVTPTQTMVGESYGLVKTGDDWSVDQADTTNTRVRITAIDEERDLVYCEFLAANVSA
jgi:hypothetical protein